MNSDDKLAELVARWREPESPPLHTDQLNQAKRNGARLDCADELEAILHPPVEGELAEVYEDSTGARFIRQTRNEQLPPAGTKLYAAPPADKQDGDVWLSKDEAQLALWQAIRDIKIGNGTDDKLILANLMRSGLWIGRMATKPAAPPPIEPVGEMTVRRYASYAMLNYYFDLHATLPVGRYEIFLRQTEPDHIPGVGEMVAARQPRQKEID